MKIFSASGVEILDVIVEDNSYRYRAIMGEHSLTLYYSLPEHVEIPIGSYCDFQGERFTLKRPENIKKHHTRDFAYTLILDSIKSNAAQYKFRDTEGRLKFSLTAKPIDHLRMVVDNLNRRESGWAVGTCIDAVEKTISYNHASCLDVLGQLSSEFETEYEVVGKVISLRKVEYNKSSPLALSYGKGNGFKSGVGRVNDGDKPPVDILFVQGGEKNIDFSKYGSRDLLLPIEQTFVYDGKEYITDSDGLSLRRKNNPNSFNEGSLDLSHIYPSRTGTVSSVAVIDEDKHLYDFTDSSIPEALDYSELQIEGETLTVVFQSGVLAGREFEVHKYVHKEEVDGVLTDVRRFELVPAEIDGVTMPNSTFTPKTGDKYAVFGMMMPEAYICDNATQSGASWDMFKEAARYLSENEDFKFTFTGELDGIWSKKDWLRIGGKIKIGGYVEFTDTQFQPDGILIRITGIKDYINKPYSPIIELATSISGASIKTDIDKIKPNEQEVEEYHKDAIRFTKRRFRDALETITMLEESLLDFSGSIDPITVRTMQLLVGDESLQFRFVTSKTAPSNAVHQITMDNETKTLIVDAGIIQHLTIGIKNISSEHNASDYKYWDLAQYVSPPLIESDKRYYLYARVSKTDESGEFLLSENAIKMNESAGYYHLLTGVLNSEYGGERSFVTLYGFTEILPGRVTTDKIVSTDGKTYFDLVNSIIGGNIRFLSEGTETDLDTWSQTVLNEINDIDTAVFDLDEYLDTALIDDIISHAEAVAIQKYINQIISEKADIEATYNKLIVNTLLSGDPKTNLTSAKNTFFSAVDSLINTVTTVIADGKVTEAEKQSVDTSFADYSGAKAGFSTRVEEANASIQLYLNDEAAGAKADAATAQAVANAASQDVSDLSGIVDDLDEYVNVAFHDGVVSEAEAKAIEKYINQILSEKTSLEATYAKLYANPLLKDTTTKFPKSNLLSAKINFFGAVDDIISIINSAIADGKVTPTEKQSVDDEFNSYRVDKALFHTRIEEANESIQNGLQANINTALAITDKFGTTVNGGLISTVMMLLREFNSTEDTAGISGIQRSDQNDPDNLNAPAFWAGGTYEQAFSFIEFLFHMKNETPAGEFNYVEAYNNLPEVIMLHNGAAKIGDFIVEDTGQIVMIDPSTGIARLTFSTHDIPTIESLRNNYFDSGSVDIWGGFEGQLTGTLEVDNDGTLATFNGVTLNIEATGYPNEFNDPARATLYYVMEKDGNWYKILGQIELNFWNQYDPYQYQTRTFGEALFFLDKGTYTFRLATLLNGNVTVDHAYADTTTIAWRYDVQGVNRQQYGRNGMMFYYSDNHFHFTKEKGFDVRGKMNMPGVLAAGSSTSGGAQSNIWGAKANSSGVTPITGGFRVPLKDLTHNQYVVQVTPYASTTFRVGLKTSTYFEVFGTGGFDYVVIGNNY